MRIDHTHKRWAIVTAVLFAVSTLLYTAYALTAPNGPSGGSWPGIAFGVAGYALMVFATLLSMRKKYTIWRIGRAQTWMRGHLWLGLLSYPLILYHSGFNLGGPLTTWLFWMLTIVIVSGVAGAALQHIMPAVLTQRVPMETIYDQIDHVQAQLLTEADDLVGTLGETAASAGLMVSSAGAAAAALVQSDIAVQDPIQEVKTVYAERIRPFLAVRGDYGNPLYIRKNAKGMFGRLRTLAPKEIGEMIDDLENICEEKRDLDRQSRLHRILHGWLILHVPLAFAVTVLGLVHAVMALRY